MSIPLTKRLIAAALGAVLAAQIHSTAAAEPKVLSQARTGQFTSLDPAAQFEQTASDITGLVYGNLLSYSYLDRPYKLVPELLAAMPEISADKLQYTLTLRKAVVFHDNKCFEGGRGRELTTDDVLYSLKRYADANINHKSWFVMEGAVVGLDEFRAETQKSGKSPDHARVEVAGLQKIDRYRFTIRLTHENPLFLYALAISSTAIVPMEAVRAYGDRFDVNPVGTGPFSLPGPAERKGVLRFVKNPKFYGVYPGGGAPGDRENGLLKAAGQKLPLVDVVEMPLIEEPQPEALRFFNGELDWRALDRANFTRMVVRSNDGTMRLGDEFAAKFNLYSTPGIDFFYFAFNMKDPLLGQNKKLRQALGRLIDTTGYINVLLNGRGAKLQSLVPLELRGNERETGATYFGYDIAAAKRLLAEAGYPDGKGLPAISMRFAGTNADVRDQADFMKAKFAAAGVQLKPDLTDGPTFVKNVEGSNFQMASYNWLADYPDAEDFYQLLYSKNAAPGPGLSSFSNAAYDKAYEASRFMADGAERLRHFKVMNEIVKEEVPLVISRNSVRFGLTQKWLSNFKRNLLTSELPYLDIDMARKKKGL